MTAANGDKKTKSHDIALADLHTALALELQILSSHKAFVMHFARAQIRLNREIGKADETGEISFVAMMLAADREKELKEKYSWCSISSESVGLVPRAREILLEQIVEMQLELYKNPFC